MSWENDPIAPGAAPWEADPVAGPSTKEVLSTAMRVNPDQAARAAQLAKTYPAPQDVLVRNLQNVELIDAVNKADQRLQTSPKLAEYMRNSPFVAQQAHDDIEPLAQIESNMAAVGAAAAGRGVLSISESIWRTPDAAQRVVGYVASLPEQLGLPRYLNPIRGVQDAIRFFSEGQLPVGPKLFAGTTDVADRISDASNLLSDAPETFGSAFADVNTLAKNTDQALTTLIKTGDPQQLGQVLTSPEYWAAAIGQAAPSLAMALYSGGAPAFLAWMEGMEQASSAADFEQRTGVAVSDAEFVQATAQTALINAWLEKAGLDRILGAQGKGLSGVLKAALAEGTTEALQEINQNLSAMLSYDEGRELLQGAVMAFMGGAGSGGGVSATSQAAGVLQERLSARQREEADAQRRATQLQEALALAAQSKLRERNPETFQQLVQQMAEQTEGAPQSVFIDAQVLLQSATPEQLAQLLPSTAEQLQEAAATNSMIEVPIAEALTNLPGTPLEQVFLQNARANESALSLAEAQQAADQAQEFLKQEADRVMQEAADQDAWVASVEKIKTTLLEQLNTAGRFTPDVNEAYATLVGQFFSVMAARTGTTPEALYARYPLRVTGVQPGQGEQVLNDTPIATYDQGEVTVTDRVDEMTGLPLNSDGTVTLYHHTSAANAETIKKSGMLKSAGEPDVYLTTREIPDTGYGDTVVRVRVDPAKLQLDDEFPDGRIDFRVNVGRPGGALRDAQFDQAPTAAPSFSTTYTDPQGETYEIRLTQEVFGVGDGRELTVQVGAFQDGQRRARVDFEVHGNTLAAGNTIVAEAYRGRGLAEAMYRAAREAGYDIMPGRKQTADGERMVARLREKGVINRERPLEQGGGVTQARAAAIKAANEEAQTLAEADIQRELKSMQESGNGPDISDLVADSRYWDPENEEFTADGFAEIDRRYEAAAREAVGAQQIEELSDLNSAEPRVQARAFAAYVDALGLTFDGPKGSTTSRYVEVKHGDGWSKFRFSDHLNQTRDSTRTSDFNVAPGGLDFTQAIDGLQKLAQASLGARPLEQGGDVGAMANQSEGVALSVAGGQAPEQSGVVRVIYRGTNDSGERISGGIAEGTLFAAADEATAKNYAGTGGKIERIGVKQDAKVLVEGTKEFAQVTGRRRGKLIDTMRKGENLKTAADDAAAKARAAGYDALEFTSFKDLGIAIFNEDKFVRDYSPAQQLNQSPAFDGPEVGNTPIGDAPEIEVDGVQRPTRNSNVQVAAYGRGGEAFDWSNPGGRGLRGDFARETKIGDTTIIYGVGSNGTAEIISVRTPQAKRGAGSARRALEAFLAEADQRGLQIKLQASPLDKKTSLAKLVQFYQSLGFELTGRKINAAGDPEMVRAARDREPAGGTFDADTITVDGQQRPTRNSAGQPIHPTEEGIRNFWRWFGDSKAVDEQGRPLVVYHGTYEDFTVFETGGQRSSADSPSNAFYFTDDRAVAKGYAPGGDVVDAYLAIENPLDLRSPSGRAALNEAIAAGDVRGPVHGEMPPLIKSGNHWGQIESLADPNDAMNGIVEWAADNGYDGLIFDDSNRGDEATSYAAFRPEQIKSATGNRGTFDPNSPNILEQGPRGTFSPSQLLITLGETSDLSTFLHESGHFFLEVMADLASQPGAPAETSADMNALLKWFGVPDLATWNSYTLDQKRKHHERFAESFEQYLLEGKAPSTELQGLFRKFRAWLVAVYKNLTQFMRGRDLQVSDDIRRVFDRMLATDEQIAAAEEAAGMMPDFDATNEAIEQLQSRRLRDMKWMVNARAKAIKALQKQAKELRKGIEAEVRAEVEQQPVYAARKALRAGPKLSIEGLESLYMGEGDRYALLDWKPLVDQKLAGKEGIHPDIAADMFGFTNGDALVRAILDAEPIDSVIEGMTDQRMLERHGDLVDERAIQEAANEAVHNEARARVLATELKAQADALNPRQATGRTDAGGRPITVNALVEAAKQFAQNLAARRRVKDLKSAAAQHRAAEARAAKRWQEATAKGDTQAAVQAKRDQLLNNYAAKALQEAQAEVKKMGEFFARVTKGNDEKVVKGGRDPDVVNAMRAILAAHDVAPRLEKGALDYMEVVRVNDPAMYAALQPSVAAAVSNAKPLREMTLEELRGLNDELRAMWLLAKRSRQMEVDGNLLDIEEAADQLVARMQEIGVPDSLPGEKGAITPRQELGIKLQFAKAILSRVEQWAERMDGKFGGPFLRLVFQPIKEAADRYRADRVKYRKRFVALLDNLAPAMPRGPIEAPELGYTFGNARDSGMAELLHALLHTGNDSNKRKLLLGRGWATENPDGTLDTRRWDAFLARMHNEGRLQKVHWDFAQGVWDLLEEMKPLAQETHRKVFGRYFAEVTANVVETPFGTYRGGYVPAQTDARIVRDAKLRELAEGENESMAYAFPAAPSGFTKARVEYNRPLLLDLRALAQHMDKVLLFSHMQGAVNDVRRLLTQKNVSYALDRIDPGAYEGMLIPWLNRAAKQIVETPTVGDRKISRFLSAMRNRAGMALMFANLSNTFQQITGFSLAAVKVRPGLMVKAMAEFTRSPKAMQQRVAEASAFMKDRMLHEVAAMNDAVESILVDPSLIERGQAWTQKHAYFLQAAADKIMSPIIWTAAYNQAIEGGQSERDAIRFADGVVRQTQGTTLPEDVSRFETGPAAVRMFTQFVNYFNMMANTNATAMKQIVDEVGVRKGAGKLFYVALMGLLVPIWVAEAIALAFRGGPEDEDDDGWLDDWLAAVFGFGTIRGLTAQIPIVGQVAQLAVNRFNDSPADDKFSLSPAVSLIESSVSAPSSVYKAIVEDGNKMKAARDVAAAATMATGLPIYGVSRPLFYLTGVADDRVEPTSEADFVRGLLTGTASPESRVP